MKRAFTVLAIMLMAATSFTQTSRRPASTNSSANRNENNTTEYSNRESVNRNTTTRENNARPNENRAVQQTPTRSTETNRSSEVNRNSDANRTATTRSTDVNRSTNVNRTETYQRPAGQSAYHGDNHRHTYTSSRRYNGSYTVTHHYSTRPESRDYRATHYVYRQPVNVEIIWTNDMHRHYRYMYPEVRYWNYHYGYRITSVSAYYADRYIGEVMNVYGRVTDVFYARETDEYFLNIGPYYPYQDFTIVLPGEIARRYGRRPVSFFTNQYISVTGLITEFEGKPEIVVKRNSQINLY